MSAEDQDVSFVVVSCDRYADLWDAFFTCFKRYWPDCPYPVYLITNTLDYSCPGVTVLHAGPDVDYASHVRSAISKLESKWLVLWLEDAMITSPVDTCLLRSLISEAQSMDAGYLKLGPDMPLSYDNKPGCQIGELPKGIRYRSAIGISLYRRDILDMLLVPGLSAWELDTSTASNHMNAPFCALTVKSAKNAPVKYINSVIKGQWYYPAVRFLTREGFGGLVKKRQRQPLHAYLYIKLFAARLAMFKLARKYWKDR